MEFAISFVSPSARHAIASDYERYVLLNDKSALNRVVQSAKKCSNTFPTDQKEFPIYAMLFYSAVIDEPAEARKDSDADLIAEWVNATIDFDKV